MNISRFYYNNENNILKIFFIFCLISIVSSEVIAYLNPKQGYEISFYSSTPPLVFIFLCAAIIGGICILCLQVFSRGYRRSRVWIGGFVLLLFTRVIILYLPYIRGYTSWMGDNSTHLGFVKDALAKGYVDPANSYPITHIFLTQITLATSLPVEFVLNHSTAIFSVLYVLSIYLLAKMALGDDKPVILTIAAIGAVIFTGYELYVMPNGWSCLFLPFALYFILRSTDSNQNFSFKILALIAIVVLPFFHPFSALVLIICLVVFALITFAFKNTYIFQRIIPPRLMLQGPVPNQ